MFKLVYLTKTAYLAFFVTIFSCCTSFAEDEAVAPATEEKSAMPKVDTPTTDKAALISYTMAGNLVRQGRPKDALRYYLTAIEQDPNFIEAICDASLIYKTLGDYKVALEMAEKALSVDEARPEIHHIIGEIRQAEGFDLLKKTEQEAGLACVQEAVKSYGKAVELAEEQGLVSERASTFFRLGEICYFANGDPEGAREYWTKVVKLHSPTPEYTDERKVYQIHTRRKNDLETWQRWAAQYLKQLQNVKYSDDPNPSPATGLSEKTTPSWKKIVGLKSDESVAQNPASNKITKEDVARQRGIWLWNRHK